MVVDTTLQFASRRNVPVRYDRDLVAATLRAMERVSEVRARRERAFYKKRMAGKRARELADARKLVAENAHLLPRQRGSELRRQRLAAAAEAEAERDDVDMLAETAEGVRETRVRAPARRMRMRADGTVEEEVVEDGRGGSGGESEGDSDDSDGLDGGFGDEDILVD